MNIEISVLTKVIIEGIDNNEDLLDPNYDGYKITISKNNLIELYKSHRPKEITNKIKYILDELSVDKRNTIFAYDIENALNAELEKYEANPEEYKDREEFVTLIQFLKNNI